tara:strand:+ start:897 stop:1070 length:174 start_codon:yes stop_codon:yes gene_type:complete
MQDNYRKETINIIVSRKLMKEARIFLLENDLEIPLKTFVEQAVREKMQQMRLTKHIE